MTTQEQRDAEYRAALGLSDGEPLPKVIGSGTGGSSRKAAPSRRWAGNAGRGARVVGTGNGDLNYEPDETLRTDDGQERGEHG